MTYASCGLLLVGPTMFYKMNISISTCLQITIIKGFLSIHWKI